MTIKYSVDDKSLMTELRDKYKIKSNIVLTKNDKAWLCLVDKYDILSEINEEGSFNIESKQINEFRESRLMAKFDHSINLPAIFKDKNLSILPTSRGSYVIAKMNTYHPLQLNNEKIEFVNVPENLETLDFENITSESVAINCALATNIFADFLEDDNLIPTINGRMGSDIFTFEIGSKDENKHKITVQNAQIEIDAGIEGENFLTLIEAKRNISKDFLVRQLYYPFRKWNDRIKKQVKSVYLVYVNGIFHLQEYMFENPERYDSIQLVKSKNYSFEGLKITENEVISMLNQRWVKEPEIPFPQANSFERIINLGDLLYSNDEADITRDTVTEEYAFDIRQTNYYTDALRYLGLVEKKSINRTPSYSLTKEGKRIFALNQVNKKSELIKKILEHGVFNKVFKEWLRHGRPTEDTVVKFMKESNLYNINQESTFIRRSSSIVSWINWIFEQIED